MTSLRKVIDVALLDSVMRKFPLKHVTHQLREMGLRTNQATDMIEKHLRKKGVID